MNISRKTTILFLITLLVTSIVIPSLNAGKFVSITNNLTNEPVWPYTYFCFDEDTGYCTLIAYPFEIIKATYYKIDGGVTLIYYNPFKLPEGLHTVEFWSITIYDTKETPSSSVTLIVDTTPPTVEIIKPEAGALYLLGSSIMNRIFSKTILCIGQIPIEVYADDKDGYGVSRVFFSYSDGETNYDDNSSDGWNDIYSNMHFGNLTLSVSAMDKKGLISEPVSITIFVYSFGFF